MAPKRKAEASGGSADKVARAQELAVVGIDFGTRGTGYAYAFTEAPDVVPKHPGGSNDATKALTAVLLDVDKHGRFKSFGQQAIEDFSHAEDGAR
jgi:hypothetical protein